jgi:FtsP/CotA-like multicopper oxidase with cupredoxin domain
VHPSGNSHSVGGDVKMDKSYYLLFVIGIFAIALIVAVVLFLVLPIQPPYVSKASLLPAAPTKNIILYAGQISGSQYGFGTEPTNITSPGPTLRFQTSDVVNITLVNTDTVPHAFQITNAPRKGASVIFNAAIASVNDALMPGESASVVFHPNIPGTSFYYICPVSSHSEQGMWGAVIIG